MLYSVYSGFMSNCELILGTSGPRSQVPLDISICSRSDAGAPVVASNAKSTSALAYVQLASRLKAKLDELASTADGPGKGGNGQPIIIVEA